MACQCIQCLLINSFRTWDPDKFNWDRDDRIKMLTDSCQKYRYIWIGGYKDYVIKKLSQ